jgi:hypothetical protein
MDAENLAPIGIRSLDRPARSESLQLLSYPGPHFPAVLKVKVKFTLEHNTKSHRGVDV